MRTLAWLLTAHALLPSLSAQADESVRVRLRAREHYEILTMQSDGPSACYRGFTNTIALGLERPYLYQVALVGSPLGATLSTDGELAGWSNTVRLVHLGVEAKAFPVPDVAPPLFGRLGVYDARLDTRGEPGTLTGKSLLLAVGLEVDLSGIGLSLEMAWRRAQLAGDTTVAGIAPALGVHFYRAL